MFNIFDAAVLPIPAINGSVALGLLVFLLIILLIDGGIFCIIFFSIRASRIRRRNARIQQQAEAQKKLEEQQNQSQENIENDK